jgi:predicted transcriptional regulator YdeE
MDITFVSKQAVNLLGMSFYGDPFKEAGDWSMDNEIGRLSKRYMDFYTRNRSDIKSLLVSEDFYEVHIYTPETETRGYFEVFVGQQLARIEQLHLELSIKILPPAQYAVFNLVGEQIISDWYMDIDHLLAQKDWQRGGSYFFQVYDRRYKGIDRIAESELTAFIPVIPSNRK